MSAEREKEAKARVAVAGAHSLTCTRHGSTTLCSCGGPSRPIAHLDAYAATIAARVDAEWRARVEGARLPMPKRQSEQTLDSYGRTRLRVKSHNAALDALAARMEAK